MQSSHRLASRAASLLGFGALSLLGLAAAHPAAAQSYSYTTITNTDLGTPGIDVTGIVYGYAAGITNAGVVVGTVSIGPFDPTGSFVPGEGYQYDTNSGAVTLLNYHAADSGPAFANVSSDGSQILGFYNPGGTGPNNYFTDSSGHISALPDPYMLTGSDPNKGFAQYVGINSSGTTLGNVSPANGGKSFLRSADGTLTTFTDTNDNHGTYAYGINSSGTVAGYYLVSSTLTPSTSQGIGFLRSASGTFTDFTVPGATDTYLDGLSDNGNYFGSYDVLDAAGKLVKSDNFTYVNGVFDTAVDVPGAAYTDIYGINNVGQIAGYYGDSNGNLFSFYASPAAVPEASTIVSFGLLLMLGGAVVIARRKKVAAAC